MNFKDFKALQGMDEKSLFHEKSLASDYRQKIKVQNKHGQLKDTSQIKKIKTYLAWIETIGRSRISTPLTL